MDADPDTPTPAPADPVTLERRAEPRVRVRAAARLQGGTEPIQGELRNLSTAGMFVRTDARVPDGTPVVLETLAWDDGIAHLLRLEGWVVRADDEGLGIRFDPPDDETGKLLTRLVRHFLVGP
jgi:hypothetical protein